MGRQPVYRGVRTNVNGYHRPKGETSCVLFYFLLFYFPMMPVVSAP